MAIKEYSVDEMAREFSSSVDRKSRLGCNVVREIKKMRDAGATPGQVSSFLLCENGPALPATMIWETAGHGNAAEVVAEVQERSAWAITMHPVEEAVRVTDRLLHTHIDVISSGALIILLGFMIENCSYVASLVDSLTIPQDVVDHFTTMDPSPWPTSTKSS